MDSLELFTTNTFNFSLFQFVLDIENLVSAYLELYNSLYIVKAIKYLDYQINYQLPNSSITIDISYLIEYNGVNLFLNSLFVLLVFSWSFFMIFNLLYVSISTVFIFIFNKLKNEIENNLSNYLDLKRLVTLLVIFLSVVLSIFFKLKFALSTFFCITFIISINVVTLFSYIYIFNINLFIFIKGLSNNYKVFFTSLIDNITLVTFVSRLFLQFLRLIICSVIFYSFHELTIFVLHVLEEYFFFFNFVGNFDFILAILKVLIEYLDMLINFNTQYSIYIISVMWLIPFLFTFIKKFLKVKNK